MNAAGVATVIVQPVAAATPSIFVIAVVDWRAPYPAVSAAVRNTSIVSSRPAAVESADVTLELVTYPSIVGMRIAANTPIIAITTINSTSVKPFLALSFWKNFIIVFSSF